MKYSRRISRALVLAVLLPAMARADGVLDECSQPALEAALAAGGLITVNCDGTLVISNTINVTTDAFLDATDHRVTITSLAGTNAVRLFTVNTGANFSLINFTLTGGRSTNGGAIYNNRGFLTLESCVLSNNIAIGTNGGAGKRGKDNDFQTAGKGGGGGNGRSAYGGAVYNLRGTTIVNRCSFLTNAATAGAGGSGGAGGDADPQGGDGGNGGAGGKAQGGAIFNFGLLIISNSTFTLNGATGGAGGIGGSNGVGRATSRAGHGGGGGSGAGGAIFNTNRARLFVYGSTFALNGARSGNSANAGSEVPRARTGRQGANSFGGAVANYGTNAFMNCTFFANKTTGGAAGNGAGSDALGGKGGDGGSAYGGNLYSAKWAAVTNCTFFDGGTTAGTNGLGGVANVNGDPGKRGARRGGNVSNAGGTFILKNSIIAFAMPGTNGYGPFKDAGYNLSSDLSIKLKGVGSMTNTDPLIGILGRNGGLTETIPLFYGSPAINAGDLNFCLAYDQRGVPRPYDSRCDIGAYEFGLTLLPPTISSQPQSVTAQPGATVTFIVVADGDPPLTYQWRQGTNHLDIANATGPVLTLVNVQNDDAGVYDVVIANNSGSVDSADVTLTLISPVEITEQPESMTVFPGSNVTFTVSATGIGPLFYQWYFNGALIPGATLSTFTVVGAQLVDAGDYQVIVYNSFSSATSEVAVLTIGFEPPTIVTQPLDLTVDAGSDATFMATASGSQPLRFQWYQNLTNPVPGGTSATLTISNVQAIHAGGYNLIVTNLLGSATSSVAVLTVTPAPPTITSQPVTNQTPCFGNSVAFSVQARGTEPLFYQWFQEGVPLANETNATLMIATVETNNAGTYTVVVSNAVGAVTSDPAELTVTSAPNITRQPLDMVTVLGSNAVFVVLHCPFPDPFTYQWCHDGIDIDGATSQTLVVTNVAFVDAGFYAVLIKNPNGEALSDLAELSVTLFFTPTMTSTNPLTYNITFDTPNDGESYTLQRRNAVDPHTWDDLDVFLGDGSHQTYTDDIPPEITTPVYRIVPTP